MAVARLILLFVLVLSLVSTSYGRSAVESYEGFQPGDAPYLYDLTTEVFVTDIGAYFEPEASVGYRVHGRLQVSAVWKNDSTVKLLKFKLLNPKLWVKTKKAIRFNDFTEHASPLDTLENEPFYALWRVGQIPIVYIGEKESTTLVNYKKGLISLFQFQLLDGEGSETDVSNYCNVEYRSLSPTSIMKLKTNCTQPVDILTAAHPEVMFSVGTTSIRQTNYELSDDMKMLRSVLSQEVHSYAMHVKEDSGNKVNVLQHVDYIERVNGEEISIKAGELKDVIEQLNKEGATLKAQTLEVVPEPYICQGECPTLSKLVKDHRDVLKSANLGSIKSAKVFIELLKTARQSTPGEILKALKSVKNKEILQQLCDLVGLTQTIPAHQAAKKFLHFDNEYDADNTERYLWALSIGSQPKEEVILDLLKVAENKNIPKKVFETLTLSIASMAKSLAYMPHKGFEHRVVAKVKNHITHELSKCPDDECRVMYMRALKNLKYRETIDLILEHASTGSPVVSVAAMKALKSFASYEWDSHVIKHCERIFFQLDKRYDSSARTLAVDIILDSEPSEDIVERLVTFLAADEKQYEVKQFLYQKLQMVAEKCPIFKSNLERIIKGNKHINNWNVLAQKGLTTAFVRPFMSTPWMNGSLVTIQEISGGVLKRGHVDVVIESFDNKKELFSLGLFAGGMSSFVGSSSEDDDSSPASQEPANAGMELTVQDAQIRPFKFFSGQGELMGHVWSGTASERTTAYQALTLLHDHQQWITLGNGAAAELSLIGAASFNLNGEIQLSVWSKVAHSVIEKSAGIVLSGTLKVDTTWIQSQVEFSITAEPKLMLILDVDFYTDVALCIQVRQPNTVVKQDIHKTEKIPKSAYRLRKSSLKTVRIPGKTYALNRKNNMMCNIIQNKA